MSRTSGIIIAFILLPLSALILYLLFFHWIRIEIAQAAFNETKNQIGRAADRLAETLPEPYVGHPFNPDQQRTVNTTMIGLVRFHQNIYAVFLIDAHGRIVVSVLESGAERLGLLQPFRGKPELLHGMTDESLAQQLDQMHDAVETLKIPIGSPDNPKAWIRVLLDKNRQPEIVSSATTRLTRRMALALLGLALAVIFIGIIVGRQMRIARGLRRQRDQAEQLAYVGTLASGLAHEIRNPINALTMQLDMLGEDLEASQPGSARNRIQRIRQGLSNIEQTVQDFLTYAVPERQKPSDVNIREVVETLCSEYHPGQTESPIHFSRQIATDLAAWCDPHGCKQILGCLIANAIRAQREQDRPIHVRIEARRDRARGRIKITVEDAGPGIPKDTAEEIFECFYTTDPDGTGLGLPIARRVAEMNGGSLELDAIPSTLGGACFILRLPPA